MSTQPSLFPLAPKRRASIRLAGPVAKPTESLASPNDAIQRRFLKFHGENPWIYRLLVRLARDMKARGFRRYGMKAIVEEARWWNGTTTTEPWKYNNNFTARYARLIEQQEPYLRGFFEKRRLK